ncbi:MAG TPA: sulfotransferase, partial [Stellaceae bacterium]|nr:sulfotransferase [Stellaceae bacterium]
MEAYRANRLAEAEEQFSYVLASEPRCFKALLMQGLIAGRTGRGEHGRGLLRRAIEVEPQSTDARLLLASLLREAGLLDEAVGLLQQAIRLRPGDAALHSELGLMHLSANRVPEAIAGFRQAIALDPGLAVAHFNLGHALERQGHVGEAIAGYQRTIALAPGLAEGFSRLGNLLHAQGRREEAKAHFERAAVAAPNTTLGRLNRAKAMLADEDLAGAEATLRDASARDPRSSEANRLLGNVQRELGRFEEAATSLRRAIELDHAQAAAYHDLVQCQKLTAADRPLLAQMHSRLADGSLSSRDRALLHFGLGKGLDDLGAFAEAIGHFDEANRLERARLDFDRDRLAAFVDRLIALGMPEATAGDRPAGSSSEVPVLILGMPRSGTTLVEQIVSSHPQVAAGGELRFWNERGAALAAASAGPTLPVIARLAEDYLARLRQVSADALRVTDKMPFNFFWIGLIRAALPRASIIHCRRNPVDTCLSIYCTRFATRQDFAYDRSDIVFYYQQYIRLMEHWRRVLSPDAFLEIDYEELVADRERWTRALIAFIGLEWDESCLRPEGNRRVVRTASMWQARQPVYRTSV